MFDMSNVRPGANRCRQERGTAVVSEALRLLVQCADLPWRAVRRVAAAGLLLVLLTHPGAFVGPVVDLAARRAEAVSRLVVDTLVDHLRIVRPVSPSEVPTRPAGAG